MRTTTLVILALSLGAFVASAGSGKVPPPGQAENEVKEVLDLHAKACERKDANAVMELFAPDPNVVAIGTSLDERLVGPARIRAAYERDFARVVSATLNYTWLSVASKGDVAWFAAEIVANVDTGVEKFSAPARWTGVLEKRGGKWLFVLSHFSLPVPQDTKGELHARMAPEGFLHARLVRGAFGLK